jgi:hypothetical protein
MTTVVHLVPGSFGLPRGWTVYPAARAPGVPIVCVFPWGILPARKTCDHTAVSMPSTTICPTGLILGRGENNVLLEVHLIRSGTDHRRTATDRF